MLLEFCYCVVRNLAAGAKWGQNVGYIPNTSLEITIVCGDNVDTVLNDSVDQTVIGICSLVVALDSLKPGVLGYT